MGNWEQELGAESDVWEPWSWQNHYDRARQQRQDIAITKSGQQYNVTFVRGTFGEGGVRLLATIKRTVAVEIWAQN